jgi:hypothetical protein
MPEWVAADGIRRQREIIDELSDDELVAWLESIEPLPDADDDDPAWLTTDTTDRLEQLLAVAQAIGERRLVAAIPPLFARAALGDGFGMMQSLRHGPERTVDSGEDLAVILIPLLRHPRAGSRRWVARELGIVRSAAGIDSLLSALTDPESLVRAEVCCSLGMIAPAHGREEIRRRLRTVADLDASPKVRREALRSIYRLT